MKFLQQFSILMMLSASIHAEETTNKILDAFFTDLSSLTAKFEQTVLNSQLNAQTFASGSLWIQRPGKFRWNYDLPYIQEIVSNGEKIWIYDADLEQVTIKNMNATLGNTPAMLLSSNKPIEENFIVQAMDKGLSLIWVELVPKDKEAGFNNIRLGFDKMQLSEMVLEDNLGQTTRLVFSALKRNEIINSELFNFVPPKNADIFDTN